jgi:hypothetical protein
MAHFENFENLLEARKNKYKECKSFELGFGVRGLTCAKRGNCNSLKITVITNYSIFISGWGHRRNIAFLCLHLALILSF